MVGKRIIWLSLFIAAVAVATPSSFTFTAPNPGWVVVLYGGAPVQDAEGAAIGPRDIVGDGFTPLLFVASDTTHAYFRMRLDETPLANPNNISPFAWGCVIDSDTNAMTYELATFVDGINNPDRVLLYTNA